MLKFNVEQIFTRCSFGKVDPRSPDRFSLEFRWFAVDIHNRFLMKIESFNCLLPALFHSHRPTNPYFPFSHSHSACLLDSFSPLSTFSFISHSVLVIGLVSWSFVVNFGVSIVFTRTHRHRHTSKPRVEYTHTHTHGKKAPVKLNQTFFNSHFEFQCFFDVYFGFYVSLCRSHEMRYT